MAILPATAAQAGKPTMAIKKKVTVQEDAGRVKVPVTLSRPSKMKVTAHWGTAGSGTASPGDDYIADDGRVRFRPGTVSRWITVQIPDDGVVEPDEDFSVSLSNARRAVIGNDTSVIWVANDD